MTFRRYCWLSERPDWYNRSTHLEIDFFLIVTLHSPVLAIWRRHRSGTFRTRFGSGSALLARSDWSGFSAPCRR